MVLVLEPHFESHCSQDSFQPSHCRRSGVTMSALKFNVTLNVHEDRPAAVSNCRSPPCDTFTGWPGRPDV